MQSPVLTYSNARPPFHDGTGEEHACIRFDCRACGSAIAQNALACLSAGAVWWEGLPEKTRAAITSAFGCRMHEDGTGRFPDARFPNGRHASFCTVDCPHCPAKYALAIDFHELQPARYIGVLQGLARIA